MSVLLGIRYWIKRVAQCPHETTPKGEHEEDQHNVGEVGRREGEQLRDYWQALQVKFAHTSAGDHAHMSHAPTPPARCKVCEKERKDAQKNPMFVLLQEEEKKLIRQTLPRGTFR